MKKILPLSLSFFALTLLYKCNGQSTDFDIVLSKVVEKTILDSTENNRLNSNRERGNILLIFYRKFISEQISANCVFDLSCSRFSSQAIQQRGLLIGILLTADRLSRCHPFIAQDVVPILFNNKSGKVIDVPEMY